ncbi:MAG TPA: NBR1-Ig-like domain-containing protein [Anaerolineales bacterium]
MPVPNKYSLLALLSVLALILSACGAASNQSVIATSVAMTVEAQNTEAAAVTPTEPAITPLPQPSLPSASLTPVTTSAPPTAPVTGSGQFCTASASFVSETIPDGTITSPGSVFTKIWRIKNTGTCAWDSTWKWVYVSGDLLGGATYYNFPAPAAPGDTVEVPVVFTAPAVGGTYRGYWEVKSPWGLAFGDSGSGNAFWVDIVVGSSTPENNKTQTVYGITSVTYDVTRTCTTANTFYTITASITSNGPLTAIFTWMQSDGHNTPNNKITFASAMTKTATRNWSQNIGSSTTSRWVQVVITDPTYQEFPQFTLPPLCNQP